MVKAIWFDLRFFDSADPRSQCLSHFCTEKYNIHMHSLKFSLVSFSNRPPLDSLIIINPLKLFTDSWMQILTQFTEVPPKINIIQAWHLISLAQTVQRRKTVLIFSLPQKSTSYHFIRHRVFSSHDETWASIGAKI